MTIEYAIYSFQLLMQFKIFDAFNLLCGSVSDYVLRLITCDTDVQQFFQIKVSLRRWKRGSPRLSYHFIQILSEIDKLFFSRVTKVYATRERMKNYRAFSPKYIFNVRNYLTTAPASAVKQRRNCI